MSRPRPNYQISTDTYRKRAQDAVSCDGKVPVTGSLKLNRGNRMGHTAEVSVPPTTGTGEACVKRLARHPRRSSLSSCIVADSGHRHSPRRRRALPGRQPDRLPQRRDPSAEAAPARTGAGRGPPLRAGHHRRQDAGAPGQLDPARTGLEGRPPHQGPAGLPAERGSQDGSAARRCGPAGRRWSARGELSTPRSSSPTRSRSGSPPTSSSSTGKRRPAGPRFWSTPSRPTRRSRS